VTLVGHEGVNFFSTKLYGHHQVSELNMSEHFLGSNIAFEILANLGLEMLLFSLIGHKWGLLGGSDLCTMY
jgi:hypothetical protein